MRGMSKKRTRSTRRAARRAARAMSLAAAPVALGDRERRQLEHRLGLAPGAAGSRPCRRRR